MGLSISKLLSGLFGKKEMRASPYLVDRSSQARARQAYGSFPRRRPVCSPPSPPGAEEKHLWPGLPRQTSVSQARPVDRPGRHASDRARGALAVAGWLERPGLEAGPGKGRSRGPGQGGRRSAQASERWPERALNRLWPAVSATASVRIGQVPIPPLGMARFLVVQEEPGRAPVGGSVGSRRAAPPPRRPLGPVAWLARVVVLSEL